jgi:hypothetical protein
MKRLIGIVLVALLLPVPIAEAKVCGVTRTYHVSNYKHKTTVRMTYSCTK